MWPSLLYDLTGECNHLGANKTSSWLLAHLSLVGSAVRKTQENRAIGSSRVYVISGFRPSLMRFSEILLGTEICCVSEAGEAVKQAGKRPVLDLRLPTFSKTIYDISFSGLNPVF